MGMVLMVIVNMYQDEFGIGPGRAQLHVAFLSLPTFFIFAYGIFSDCVPFFKSQKKSYLLVMSTLQTISCILIVLSTPTPDNVMLISFLIMINSLGMAWTDVLVDGLMVT